MLPVETGRKADFGRNWSALNCWGQSWCVGRSDRQQTKIFWLPKLGRKLQERDDAQWWSHKDSPGDAEFCVGMHWQSCEVVRLNPDEKCWNASSHPSEEGGDAGMAEEKRRGEHSTSISLSQRWGILWDPSDQWTSTHPESSQHLAPFCPKQKICRRMNGKKQKMV